MKAPLDPIITVLQQRFARKVEVTGTPSLSIKTLMDETRSQWKKDGLQWDNMGVVLSKAFDQVQWWLPNQSHQELEKIDQQTLTWAKSAGFLQDVPVVRSRTKKSILGLKRIPAFYFPTLSTQKGEIMMASDEFGVLGLSKKDNVFFSNHPVEERLFVLFHEASHSVFEDLEAPFQLPASLYTEGFTPEHAQLINGTYFALNLGSQAVATFNEMFADTYGAIMLLAGCGFSAESQEFLKQTMSLRANMQSQYEVERVVNGKRSIKKFAPHNTATALRDLMNNVEQLKGKSAEELQKIACEIASVNWIKWLNPQRNIKNAHGESVEQKELALDRLFSENIVRNTIVHIGFRWIQGDNFEDIVQKSHPKLRAPLKKMVEYMLEDFNQNLSHTRKQLQITTLFNGIKERAIAMAKMSSVLKDLQEDEDFKGLVKKMEKEVFKTHNKIIPALENLTATFMQYAQQNKLKKVKI